MKWEISRLLWSGGKGSTYREGRCQFVCIDTTFWFGYTCHCPACDNTVVPQGLPKNLGSNLTSVAAMLALWRKLKELPWTLIARVRIAHFFGWFIVKGGFPDGGHELGFVACEGPISSRNDRTRFLHDWLRSRRVVLTMADKKDTTLPLEFQRGTKWDRCIEKSLIYTLSGAGVGLLSWCTCYSDLCN